MGEVRMGCAITAGLLFLAAFIGTFKNAQELSLFEIYL
jgi:hypothetical protein